MRQPPPISQFRRYPATAATAALAVIVTALVHWQPSFGAALDMSYWAFHGQPWRLVTSALPHSGVLHLAFDLYWFWVFGTLIEEYFGWWRTGSIYLLLAIGSSAAEYAMMSGGVGLSGIGYGLFAMLWVLERRDARSRRHRRQHHPPVRRLA